jgi:uncharacterized membrane protein
VIGFLRRNFITGMLSLAPLVITCWIIWRFYRFVSATMRPWLGRIPGLQETYPEALLTLFGVVIFVLLVVLAGAFTRNLIGIAFFRLVEQVVQRIPVVKSMYSGTKQIAQVFLADHRTAFKHVVVFEYPRRGIHSLGFMTAEAEGEGLATVFLPTTPNPTSGYMLLVPRRDLRVVDIPVEAAIKLIVSGGSILEPGQAALIGGEVERLAGDGPREQGKDGDA